MEPTDKDFEAALDQLLDDAFNYPTRQAEARARVLAMWAGMRAGGERWQLMASLYGDTHNIIVGYAIRYVEAEHDKTRQKADLEAAEEQRIANQQGKEPALARQWTFEQVAALLPEGACWGDPVTPDMVMHIVNTIANAASR